jgi:hypothetical protein
LIKEENGDLPSDSHSVSNILKNHFCQLLNACDINDARLTEMHKTEPSVCEPSSFEVWSCCWKGEKICKVLINSDRTDITSEIHKHINLE